MRTRFAIEDEVIQTAIGQNYDFPVRDLAFLPKGDTSYAYRATGTDGTKIFLKLFDKSTGKGKKSIRHLKFWLPVTRDLYDRGFRNIAYPIENSHGGFTVDIGPAILVLFPYIEGETLENAYPFHRELLEKTARGIAGIHDMTDSLRFRTVRIEDFDLAFLDGLEKDLALLEQIHEGSHTGVIRDVLKDIRSLADEMESQADGDLGGPAGDDGNEHGNYTGDYGGPAGDDCSPADDNKDRTGDKGYDAKDSENPTDSRNGCPEQPESEGRIRERMTGGEMPESNRMEKKAGSEGSVDPEIQALWEYVLPRKGRILDFIDQLYQYREQIECDPYEMVLTHGDIWGGNLILDPKGELYFIDWESARIAPREADLRHYLFEDFDFFLEKYREAYRGPVHPDPNLLGFYVYRSHLENLANWISRMLHDNQSREQNQSDFECVTRHCMERWDDVEKMMRSSLLLRSF